MRPDKLEILKGNALFVLENLVPLNVFEIAYVWGMYSDDFWDALHACNCQQKYAGFYGPYWETPTKDAELIKKTLLEEGLVDEITESVKGKNAKSLKINKKGLDYLESLVNNGAVFKGLEKLKKLKPEVIQYRADVVKT